MAVRYLTWHRISPGDGSCWYQSDATAPFVRAFVDIKGMGIYVLYLGLPCQWKRWGRVCLLTGQVLYSMMYN